MKPGTFTRMYVQLVAEYRLLPGRFCWQEGYGGFTYSRVQIDDVYKYIKDQEFHHSGKTFRREYIDYLENDEIVFDEMYLFEFYD